MVARLMQIIGLDLSLTSTGLAWSSNGTTQAETLIPPTGAAGLERIHWIVNRILERLPTDHVTVAIEDFSFHSKGRGVLERAGLAYMVRHHLWLRKIPWYLVAPATLKLFATGRGQKVQKAEIVASVIRRWGVYPRTDDEADAVVLAQIGRALTGSYDGPLLAYQTRALEGVKTGEMRGQ